MNHNLSVGDKVVFSPPYLNKSKHKFGSIKNQTLFFSDTGNYMVLFEGDDKPIEIFGGWLIRAIIGS
jgi:hypothetical protein